MSNKNGILFALPRIYPSYQGGVELFHYYFIKNISNYYNVFTCTFSEVPKKCNIIVKNCKDYFYGSKILSKIICDIFAVCKYRRNIDLIHIPYTSKSLIQDYHLLFISKLFHIPFILRIHGGGMHPSRPHLMHQALFNNAAGIVAVSTPIKIEYEKRHSRNILVIPSMLPFKKSGMSRKDLRDELEINNDDIVILFLGTIKNIKGPDILLNAFTDLGENYIKRKRLKLIFVGEGKLKNKLESKIKLSQLKNHVIFYGHIPHEKVCKYYELSDIYVIPSLMEARPLSLSEALFHGVATIGSDIPTIKNLIENFKNGLIFKSENAKDLCDKLKMLIENRKLRVKLGEEAGKLYNNSYNFDRMVKKYCDFYDEIIYK